MDTNVKKFVNDVLDGKLDGIHITDKAGLLAMGEIITWVRARDKYVQFPASAPTTGSVGVDITVPINLTDGDGTIDTFGNDVTCDISKGGTATYTVTPQTGIAIDEGIASVVVNASTVGDCILTITNISKAGVTAPATLTITIS